MINKKVTEKAVTDEASKLYYMIEDYIKQYKYYVEINWELVKLKHQLQDYLKSEEG